eukprot:contig_21086_g5182
MTQMSMTQSDADPCLFYRDHADGRRTFLLVYVDDFLLAAARQADIDELKAQIMEAFASKDIGPPTFFLGLHINHSRSTRELTVSQQQYVRALLERNGLTDANPVRLPMVVGVQLEPAPTVAHYAAAKTVLRYLKGTLEWGLRYGARGGLVGYSDADFAGDVDTRRSTSGYVFVLNGAAVSCLSKVQPTVATSTMEAEYIASVQAAREAVWLKLLIKTLMRTDNAVPLRCDNQGALRLADHPGGTPRSKHIDVGHHFVRDRAARGDITLVYVPTAEMVADVLTKALPMALLSTCRHGLGLLALAPIG